MYNIRNLPFRINVGRETETGVKQVVIDCAYWLELWPSLSISIWVTPPKGKAVYPAATRMNGSKIVWDINDSDTAVPGLGTMEVVGVANGRRKLSSVVQTFISETSIDATAKPPEPATPWVEQVLDAAKRAEDAADRAENACRHTAEIVDGVLVVN